MADGVLGASPGGDTTIQGNMLPLGGGGGRGTHCYPGEILLLREGTANRGSYCYPPLRRYYYPVIQGDAAIQGRYCFPDLRGRYCYPRPDLDLLLQRGRYYYRGRYCYWGRRLRYCYPGQWLFCCPRGDTVIHAREG